MRNRLTFTNLIGVLLENKKKTYPQHQLVRNLFSAYLDDTLTSSDLIVDDNIQYSRWCNGTRPIPMDIIKAYEDDEWDTMEDDFHDKIIPNLINPSNAHLQMQELLKDSIPVIGQRIADELLAIADDSTFFTQVMRYAILNDHHNGNLYSPDLSEHMLSCRVPSHTKEFVGRTTELKLAYSKLDEHSLLFVTGVPGIGKSEFAKMFAAKYKKK